MDKKLSNINVDNLKNSVALVIMGAQFEGIDPIINQSSIKEMDDLFNFLYQNKQIHAFIRGHVCCGNDMKLSKKRAKYVYSELIKKGIDANRLRFQGFSNSLLLVSPEKTDADRAKNRRVDVIFSVKPIQSDK
jgi:outer membrane protein OmpA-like peptidoglycan-associated protein